MNNIGLKFAFASIAFARVAIFACGAGGSIWEGTTDSWNTDSNWSNDVPGTMCSNGTISASPHYFPILDVNATAPLRFQGSSTLTIPTGFSFTPSPGFVALSGASPIIYVSGGTLTFPSGSAAGGGSGSFSYNLSDSGVMTFEDGSVGLNGSSIAIIMDLGTLNIAGAVSLDSIDSSNSLDEIVLTTGGSSSGLTLTGTSSFTLLAEISSVGECPLTFEGSGTMTLLGDNSYEGGTFISTGTVVIASDSNLGNSSGSIGITDGGTLSWSASGNSARDVTLTGSGGNVFIAEGSSVIMSGDWSGSGSFQKIGEGLLSLTGDLGYTGTTTISRGVFSVNNTMSSPVTVGTSATLKGTGTITGDVIVNGTAAPGNSIGTLFVVGDYTQADGSTLDIEISPSENSLISVDGNIIIGSGTTLNITLDSGSYSSKSYTVLSSTGTLSGTFASLTSSSDLFSLSLDYQSSRLVLLLSLTAIDLASLGNSNNTYNVAIALDEIWNDGSGSFTSVIDPLLTMDKAALNESLNQMHPALFKGLVIAQENNAVQVQNALSYRLLNRLDSMHSPFCRVNERRLNVWGDGIGESLHQKTTIFQGNFENGYQENMAGVVIGVDGRIGRYVYLGALGAYTDSGIKWSNLQGKGNIYTGYGGLYLSALGELFYANLSCIGAWSHYQGKRNIIYSTFDETATNGHGGAQLLSHLDTGLNWGVGRFVIRPFDSFNYISQTENSFTETGAGLFNLSVQKSQSILIRNELGLTISCCFCGLGGRWIVSPKASWVREVRVKGEGYSSRLATTDVQFETVGFFPDRSLFSPGVSLAGDLLKDLLSLELYYNGNFCHEYSDHNYGGQIRLGF